MRMINLRHSKRILVNKLDKTMKIYLAILILSWIIITVLLVRTETGNEDDFYKKELKSYPYDHSKITDSTLKTK